MATAEELLMAAAEPNTTTESNEEILVADLNTRVISIPATLKILGVESDDDTKRLQFKIPRHYGEFDLSTFKFHINFENAKRNGDVYPVKDVIVDGDYLLFTWLVDRVAYEYAGDVKFSICMKLYDDTGLVVKELNTTYATLPVLEGLETEKALVEQNPSAFDQVMYRLYTVEAANSNGQNGYYSVIRVAQADSGTLFTIINQDGESIAYVRHGRDGVDGYTPQKGVDYWTPEDKATINKGVVDYTQQQLINWAPRSTTVILTANGWGDNQQVVAVEGVTADNIVVIAPSPEYSNYKEYSRCDVRCIEQSDGYLTFNCVKYPEVDLNVSIVVYYSRSKADHNSTVTVTVTDDGEGNVIII